LLLFLIKLILLACVPDSSIGSTTVSLETAETKLNRQRLSELLQIITEMQLIEFHKTFPKDPAQLFQYMKKNYKSDLKKWGHHTKTQRERASKITKRELEILLPLEGKSSTV